MRPVDYSMLPKHMQHGARDYLEHGYQPGSFLYAALCNDLVQAFACADDINTVYMKSWAQWLYWECPHAARGSQEKVDAWIAHRGWEGPTSEANEAARARVQSFLDEEIESIVVLDCTSSLGDINSPDPHSEHSMTERLDPERKDCSER